MPRRLLMTADTVGGVWTYALELSRALGTHGVEVALATMGKPLTPAQWETVRNLSNVEVFESSYKLEWMPEPWADVAAAGDWLLELAQRTEPDLLHLNGYAHAALPWSVPKLVVGHSCVLSWWQAVHKTQAPAEWNQYRAAVAAGLKAADVVVAPSRAMLTALSEHYGPIQATRVIPNGRQPTLFGSQPKEEFILTAGRLWDAAKNVGALAAVAPELPWPVYVAGEEQAPGATASVGRVPPLGAPLVGRGPSRGGPEAFQPAAKPLAGPIRRLGALSFEELLPWFGRASIYALPARYEPFGLSALEAALAGCALVLGDIPSLREIWGEAAVYVSPDRPAQIKATLETLIADGAWRAELSAQASHVAAQYTPERMAHQYLQAYAQAHDAHWSHPYYQSYPEREVVP